MTAAHTLDNAGLGDPNTEAVPEATGVRMKVLDEMEVEDGERLLALWTVAVVYEQQIADDGSLPSCHSLMPDEWGSRRPFGRMVQSLLEVSRT